MFGLLVAAGLLLFSLGLVHSVLGEVLFFRHMEGFQGLPSILGGDDFPKRTLRVTWHIPSILAWAFASILIDFAFLSQLGAGERFVVETIALSQLLCAVVTSAGTKGKHPAWVAFLAVAVLCWMAAA
jgi:hypothetical protein